MELLQPLAIRHVGLAAAHIVHLASIDQHHLQAVLLQNL